MISSSNIFNARILIVDDNESDICLLEQMLLGAGYTSVSSTRNSREVSALYLEHHYSLIMLDLQMPNMDGFQVMEALKSVETGGYLPVLVQTSDSTHRLRALKSGARDFISKPFDLAEVLLRVHNLIEVRLMHREADIRRAQAESASAEIKHLNQTLEQRVNQRTEQMQEANKELQAFSYSVSHDLRAPLRHVLGFVELLKKGAGPSLSEENLSHLTTISESAKRMGSLIDDLLAFSKIGQASLHKRNVDLDELIQDTLQDFQEETKERRISWDIHPVPPVWADRALLRMVLINLISNAVKFTGDRPQPKIEIGSAPGAGDETVTFVRDNGAGFNPRYTEKLFGVFQRLHSQSEFEGTGIGLANVKRIVHRHGGRTWAEGKIDSGATFYFSMPKQRQAE